MRSLRSNSEFYLEEYPSVKKAGVKPYYHYEAFGTDGDRYPNLAFKTFGESDGTLVASADLTSSQFGELQDLAGAVALDDGAGLEEPIIWLIGGGLAILGTLSIKTFEAGEDFRQLLEQSAIGGFVYQLPRIQIEDNLEDTSDTGSIPDEIMIGTEPFDLGELTEIEPGSIPDGNDFIEDILDGKFEFPDAEESGSYFLASASSQSNGLYTPETADILLNSQENITLELFGGTSGQLPGAINVDIVAEQGIRADLLADGLSFIPDNSVEEIVTFNPFIPKDAGGTGILDYLPEAARTLEPGGQIIINGTTNNKFTKVKQSLDLESLGLRVVEKQVPLLDRFSDLTFRTIDGNEISKERIKTTILEKI